MLGSSILAGPKARSRLGSSTADEEARLQAENVWKVMQEESRNQKMQEVCETVFVVCLKIVTLFAGTGAASIERNVASTNHGSESPQSSSLQSIGVLCGTELTGTIVASDTVRR